MDRLDLRCGNKCRWTWRADYNDRNCAVGKHLDSFATKYNRGDSAATMRGHHDCITFFFLCRVDNRFVRLLMLNAHQIAHYT